MAQRRAPVKLRRKGSVLERYQGDRRTAEVRLPETWCRQLMEAKNRRIESLVSWPAATKSTQVNQVHTP